MEKLKSGSYVRFLEAVDYDGGMGLTRVPAGIEGFITLAVTTTDLSGETRDFYYVRIPQFVNDIDFFMTVDASKVEAIEKPGFLDIAKYPPDPMSIPVEPKRNLAGIPGLAEKLQKQNAKLRCLACNAEFGFQGDFNQTCIKDGAQLIIFGYDSWLDSSISDESGTRFSVLERFLSTRLYSLYRASDLSNGQVVSIKVPHSKIVLTEASILSALNHPSIAKMFSKGRCSIESIEETNNEFDFFVMEDLSESPRLSETKDISFAQTVEVGVAVAEALSYIHSLGLHHPLLSAADIAIPDKNEAAKLLNFFPAEILCNSNGTYTINGILIADVSTLSPEILRGQVSSSAANVYSLAIILYQCFTGRKAFAGLNAFQQAYAIWTQPAPGLLDCGNPNITQDFALMIERCLSKEPSQRPPVDELLAALLSLRCGIKSTNSSR